MSSSCGEPSKKLTWVKKMQAQTDYENKLLDMAKRGNLKVSTKPAHLLSKKEKQANQAIELAIELKKREDQREAQKKKQQEKEKASDN